MTIRTDATVTINDASLATGIPASTIRRWVASGQLSSRKTSGLRYVRLDHVQQLRDTLRVRPGLQYLTR